MDAAVYSEALEQQLALLQWVPSSQGHEWFDACNEVGAAQGLTGGAPWNAEGIRKYLLHPLTYGAPVYWDAALVPTLEQARATLPIDTVLTADTLPAMCGFLWIPGGVQYRDVARLRAVVWGVWTYPDDSAPDLMLTPVVGTAPRAAGVPLGGAIWPLGATFQQAVEYTAALYDDPRDFAALAGCPSSQILAIAGAAFLFMGSPLCMPPGGVPAHRTTRRRAERFGWDAPPLIRVVELRHAMHSGTAGDDSRHWGCQWVVSGHWRQQPCGPGRVNRRPTWVLPHVKGPADKPLKPPSTKVFAVVR